MPSFLLPVCAAIPSRDSACADAASLLMHELLIDYQGGVQRYATLRQEDEALIGSILQRCTQHSSHSLQASLKVSM